MHKISKAMQHFGEYDDYKYLIPSKTVQKFSMMVAHSYVIALPTPL